ncbi:MAG: hypothetical protein KKB51_22045 [Candidatus Riflebacteria bacterium]|nr:hypothetical protein [Candidatus Riflebacteria bacterium]
MPNLRDIFSGNRLGRRATFNAAVTILMFCAGVVPAAEAYLDPGTFSFVLQTLIAALVGGLFVIKSYWITIKNWFSGKSAEVVEPDMSDSENCKANEDDDKNSQQ